VWFCQFDKDNLRGDPIRKRSRKALMANSPAQQIVIIGNVKIPTYGLMSMSTPQIF
jgi:hypothetical protein